MGAYNEVVRAEEELCPRCGSSISRKVQFKYGETWQHLYVVGDRLAWGSNDNGEPGYREVVVLGFPERCPVCGFEPDGTYEVLIKDDVIVNVYPSSKERQFPVGSTYVVLEF